ncbi:MAG: hypothetical protein ACI8RZ_006930 [Myxococcota bacterium]
MSLVKGLHSEYYTDAPDDVEIITVLTEDTQANPADADDCADFIDFTGVTFPVLGDAEGDWLSTWGAAGGTSQHSYTILNTDGTIAWRLDDGSSSSVSELSAMMEEAQ